MISLISALPLIYNIINNVRSFFVLCENCRYLFTDGYIQSVIISTFCLFCYLHTHTHLKHILLSCHSCVGSQTLMRSFSSKQLKAKLVKCSPRTNMRHFRPNPCFKNAAIKTLSLLRCFDKLKALSLTRRL